MNYEFKMFLFDLSCVNYYFINADFSYHFQDYNKMDRRIPFVDGKAKGDTNGRAYDLNIEMGSLYYWGNFTAIPIIGLDFEDLHIEGYSERGAGFFDLHVDEQQYNSLVGKMGGQIFWNICKCSFLPFVEIYYEREFSRNDKTLKVSPLEWNDNSAIYNSIGDIEKNYVSGSLGFYTNVSGFNLNVSYLWETNFSRMNNTVIGELNCRF